MGGPEDHDPDGDLLRAAAAGDHAAFRRLAERHGAAALALARRITGNAADAEDLTQEALLRAWLAAPSWNPAGPARFATWLYRVVFNLCVDRLRRPGLAPAPLDEDMPAGQPDGFDGAAAEQRRAIVAEALATLAPRQRHALELCTFAGITAIEAARRLSLSPSAVDSLLARGRRALRKRLERRGITRIDDIL